MYIHPRISSYICTNKCVYLMYIKLHFKILATWSTSVSKNISPVNEFIFGKNRRNLCIITTIIIKLYSCLMSGSPAEYKTVRARNIAFQATPQCLAHEWSSSSLNGWVNKGIERQPRGKQPTATAKTLHRELISPNLIWTVKGFESHKCPILYVHMHTVCIRHVRCRISKQKKRKGLGHAAF